MAITAETAKEHANDLAVTCCRFEAGTVIDPSNLEDPAIFPDLEDSGLLEMPANTLKIGEVLGATLKTTVDALTPLTADVLDGVTAMASETPEAVVETAPVVEAPAAMPTMTSNAGVLKLHIGKGENIQLEIPMGIAQSMGVPVQTTETVQGVTAEPVQAEQALKS